MGDTVVYMCEGVGCARSRLLEFHGAPGWDMAAKTGQDGTKALMFKDTWMPVFFSGIFFRVGIYLVHPSLYCGDGLMDNVV